VVAIGSSTNLAYHLGVPVMNALVDSATGERLLREKYFMPGSVHQVRVDNSHPVAYGLPEILDIYFNNNPVFRLGRRSGLNRIAWFDSDEPLRSGWAWGQEYLQNGVVAVDARVGEGKLFLFSPLITFRAQPHGTFKLLFNAIFLSIAEQVGVGPS
jgi:hypothetical protein